MSVKIQLNTSLHKEQGCLNTTKGENHTIRRFTCIAWSKCYEFSKIN